MLLRRYTQLVTVVLCFTLSACSPPLSEAELVARATESFVKGDLSAAELDVKTALQQNTNNAAARSLYGQIFLRQVNPSAAVEEFERALRVGDSAEGRRFLAKALVQAGESAELLSEVDAGWYVLLEGDPEFQAILARAYLAQTEYEEARAALAEADLEGNDYIDITRAVFDLQLEKDTEAAVATLKKVVARNPANAHAWSLLGILANQDRDRAGAEEYFAKAAAANPYRIGDRLQLVETQIRLGKGDAAGQDLSQLEKLIPNYPEVNFFRGQLYFDAGEYKNAIDAFTKVLNSNPNHAGALLLSANANAREANLALAQRQFSQFLLQQPGHLQASLQLANVAWQLGDASETEALARAILKEHEMDVRALGLLAMALSAQGMHTESAQAYAQIASLQPDSIEARVALGSQQVVAGDAEAGIEQLQAAVALDPASATARERLIEAYLGVKDIPAAEDAARAYREQAPDDPRSAIYLGRVLLQSEDLDGARASFQEALNVDPGNIAANGGMAALAVLGQDLAGAKSAFETALEANPGNLVTSMNLAVILEQIGDLDEMQRVLSDAVKANQEAVEPRLASARYALSQNRAGEAITLMTAVEDSASGDFRVAQLLAGAYLTAGQPEAAANRARTLLDLRGDDPNVLGLVARVEAANQRPEQAQIHLEKALAAQPARVDLRKLLIEALIQQRDLEQASTEIAKLPESVQNEPAVLAVRGRLAMAATDVADARKLFAQAFEQQRNNTNLALLAGAQWALGEQAEVIAALEAWLVEYPDDMLTLNTLASRQIEVGDESKALASYTTIVEAQPDNIAALNNLAWLSRKSDPDAALKYIVRADKAAPQSAQIKDTYAMVELERGEFERALALNRKALDAAPGSLDIRYNLAQILLGAGRADEAKALLAQLVAGPAFASQSDAQALLDSM